jgi:hypothetical protein
MPGGPTSAGRPTARAPMRRAAGRLRLDLPAGVALEARYSDISEVLDRKAAGISLYASQIGRLFETEQRMLDDLAGYHARVAAAGGISGYAERYWGTVKP